MDEAQIMHRYSKILAAIICSLAFPLASAASPESGDMYITGYSANATSQVTGPQYTVLDANQYQQLVHAARLKVQQLQQQLANHPQDMNAQTASLAAALADIPYIYSGAEGEGDWRPDSYTYQAGFAHVRQDPVYRLDGLNCQTYVQVALALLHSRTIDQFDKAILKISYGAAGNLDGNIVAYYNRNNFVDGDWNPVNEKHGWMSDVTSRGILSPDAATTSANITRQNWFSFQQKDPGPSVRVLHDSDGPAMVKRFMTVYSALNFPNFDSENVSISYLPKEKIALPQAEGNYQPNEKLLKKIPTPAVIEIIRDTKKWMIDGKNIKDVIGSELSVSHMGLLYRQNFHYGDLIYQKITCDYDSDDNKVCHVKPVKCQKQQCQKLMFTHATDSHPDGYYWYKQADGNYACTAKPPANHGDYTRCNRVVSLPLFDYLTDFQYGSYHYMKNASILGVHIESLTR